MRWEALQCLSVQAVAPNATWGCRLAKASPSLLGTACRKRPGSDQSDLLQHGEPGSERRDSALPHWQRPAPHTRRVLAVRSWRALPLRDVDT